MGIISDIFANVANDGVPLMSPDVAASMPKGLPEMMTSTDIIMNADDVLAITEQQASNPAPQVQGPPTEQQYDEQMQLGGYIQDVINGVASATYFHDAVGSRDVGAVSAMAKEQIGSLGSRRLEIVLGTPEDNDAVTYLHENAHLERAKRNGGYGSSIQEELYADYKGNQDYYRAYQKGIVSDPEVPYAARAQRAIDVMEMGDYGAGGPEGHSVAAVSPLPGEKYVGTQYTSNKAVGDAMLQARAQIIDEIGGDLTTLSDAKKLQTMQGLAYADPSMNPALKQQIFEANAEAVTNLNGKFDSVEKIEAQMPPELRATYNERVAIWEKAEQAIAAETAIQEQPGLLYETSKRMLQTGEFDKNPAGKQFVENYVDGIERYDPIRHGVAPEDRPTERPEVVDRLAEQYAPRAEPVLQNSYAR